MYNEQLPKGYPLGWYAIYFVDTLSFLRDGPRDEVVRFYSRNGAAHAIATLSRCVNREATIVEMYNS